MKPNPSTLREVLATTSSRRLATILFLSAFTAPVMAIAASADTQKEAGK